ncbi:hypothetical protein [Neorhizobium alkalisoli]|uniref:Uncharacterized protein n=1 Tax=Neorhizobium alkalisoli TaxID=528178 RepID=A0A561Q7K9_9HYPH|nr:hypothetical protein [Neorhizobium alkalisoli]TWF46330.1 hypothetical protein FHW37_11525 [Neorhizobium alkalisoli]
MSDWKTKIIEKDTVLPSDWRKRAMESDAIAAKIFEEPGPNPLDLDTSADAPNYIRLQVGALDKPEDRLAALRKTYPDAKPYGEDNFIYTDEKRKGEALQ